MNTLTAQSQNAQGQILYDASEALALSDRARIALDQADLIVDSDSMLAIAAEDLKSVKGLQQLVEDRRTAITKPLNQALKQVNDLFRAPKEYLVLAEKRLKDAILVHTSRQEQIAAAARARAEQAMQEQSALLLAQQVEHQRGADEAERAANEALLLAQEAASRGDLQAAESARQSARAQMEVAQQRRELESETLQLAQVLSLPGAATSTTRIDGVSGRTTYIAEVTDFIALVRAVAAGQAPLECLRANDKFLAAQARAFKRTGLIYPGVQAASQRSLAVTSAR